MLDHLIDPDPDDSQPRYERAEARLVRLARAVARLSGHVCTADLDGDDDDLCVSLAFYGLTLADFDAELGERIADLYHADQRAGGVR